MNVEKIREFMRKNMPKAHPIEGHWLADMDDYVRKQYVDMLCVFAQYENKDVETAGIFITRLMTGAGMTEPVSEHIRNAMEITVEKFEEFLRLCEENDLQKYFFLDAVLVSCAGGTPEKKQIEFLAEVAETLKLDKEEVQDISKLAVVILAQSEDAYNEFLQEADVKTYKEFIISAYCYLKDAVPILMLATEDSLYIYSPQQRAFDLISCCAAVSNGEGLWAILQREVVLENLELNASEVSWCHFRNAETVKMKNCRITNWRFYFGMASDIQFEGCEFTMRDGTDVTIDYLINTSNSGSVNLTVESCYFHDIKVHSTPRYSLIAGSTGTNAHIIDSEFNNVRGEGYFSIIAVHVNIHLKDCQFIDCRKSYLEYLFDDCNIMQNENCEFKNCADLKK